MQSYLQEINQIEWEIFFTNKVLTKFFQQKYCDIINVAISCLKEALMQSKVIEKSVKYGEIFWHFFSLKSFKNFPATSKLGRITDHISKVSSNTLDFCQTARTNVTHASIAAHAT